jgi:hypothetical protein
MVTVSRQVLLPFLALVLVPLVLSVLAPNPLQAGETPSFLLASAAPTERLAPPVTWLDDLENRLTTYFTKKYPTYDFAPYAQELDRIRGAISLGDRWGAKREMGVFLTMLASRLWAGDDAPRNGRAFATSHARRGVRHCLSRIGKRAVNDKELCRSLP